jgi:hypothetical protein
MSARRARVAWGSAIVAVALALATGGMRIAPSELPVRMSNLEVQGLGGFAVVDSTGLHIGQVVNVDADRRGHARWVRIALNQGGEARVASFRAWLDASERTIALQLPEDIVLRRAEAEALNSLSIEI